MLNFFEMQFSQFLFTSLKFISKVFRFSGVFDDVCCVFGYVIRWLEWHSSDSVWTWWCGGQCGHSGGWETSDWSSSSTRSRASSAVDQQQRWTGLQHLHRNTLWASYWPGGLLPTARSGWEDMCRHMLWDLIVWHINTVHNTFLFLMFWLWS